MYCRSLRRSKPPRARRCCSSRPATSASVELGALNPQRKRGINSWAAGSSDRNPWRASRVAQMSVGAQKGPAKGA
jgi:hypothetical protein